MAIKSYNNEQEELKRSVSYGASFDNINLRSVTFWLIFGVLLVVIILYGLYNMYSYNQFLTTQETAINTEYQELAERREQEHEKLNSLELIDEENRRYRIPIDSAITLIANERN